MINHNFPSVPLVKECTIFRHEVILRQHSRHLNPQICGSFQVLAIQFQISRCLTLHQITSKQMNSSKGQSNDQHKFREFGHIHHPPICIFFCQSDKKQPRQPSLFPAGPTCSVHPSRSSSASADPAAAPCGWAAEADTMAASAPPPHHRAGPSHLGAVVALEPWSVFGSKRWGRLKNLRKSGTGGLQP